MTTETTRSTLSGAPRRILRRRSRASGWGCPGGRLAPSGSGRDGERRDDVDAERPPQERKIRLGDRSPRLVNTISPCKEAIRLAFDRHQQDVRKQAAPVVPDSGECRIGRLLFAYAEVADPYRTFMPNWHIFALIVGGWRLSWVPVRRCFPVVLQWPPRTYPTCNPPSRSRSMGKLPSLGNQKSPPPGGWHAS